MATHRVNQWAVFARKWWIYDAMKQCPFKSSDKIALYLEGKHKPIYHALSDVGDHVVVINSQHIAMPDRLWKIWRYFKHSGHGGGFSVKRAWQQHEEDPTQIIKKEVKARIKGTLLRPAMLMKLHVFPDEEIPEDILRNVSGQIRQVMPIPRQLHEYSPEEIEEFPRLFTIPRDYVEFKSNKQRKSNADDML